MSTPLPFVRSAFIVALVACGLGLWLGPRQAASDTAAGPATTPATMPATTPATDFAQPTRITLHLKDAALDDAVAALGKAAGVKFSIADAAWDAKGVAKTISLDVNQKPFWEALFTLCDRSGLSLPPPGFYSGNSSRIPLSPAIQFGPTRTSIAQLPHFLYGPFLVTANNIQRIRNLGDKSNRDSLTLQMTAYCQPGTRVGQLGQLAIDEAVDETGASLAPDGPRTANPYFYDVTPGWSYNFTASLQAPADAGKKIARLKASLPLVLISRVETLEVPDIATITTPVHKTLGDCTYTVNPLKPGTQKDTWELDLAVTRDNVLSGRGPGYSIFQSSQLLDADGNAWRGAALSAGGNSAGKMTYKMTYYSPNAGIPGGDKNAHTPAKFVMEVPTQTRELTLPVEFKDLPLP